MNKKTMFLILSHLSIAIIKPSQLGTRTKTKIASTIFNVIKKVTDNPEKTTDSNATFESDSEVICCCCCKLKSKIHYSAKKHDGTGDPTLSANMMPTSKRKILPPPTPSQREKPSRDNKEITLRTAASTDDL